MQQKNAQLSLRLRPTVSVFLRDKKELYGSSLNKAMTTRMDERRRQGLKM